jgi:hypothetical protein
MKMKHLLLLIALLGAAATVRATTVIPPTFDQLVDQAEVIFQGSVTDVKSQWIGEGAERSIVSYITFKVEESLKGGAGQTYTIRMLGGTVGEDTMEVSDAPRFHAGDRDIVFVENNGSQFVPLVGIMHGRFHVRRNQAGKDVVTDNDDEPVRDVTRLGRESNGPSPRVTDLSPDDFKAAIKGKINEAAAAQGHPAQ